MPVLIVLGALLVAALIFGPQWWVRHALRKHGDERADFPGTGAELARHLLDRAGLVDVKVELVDEGDHYSPADRAVRLSQPIFEGRSLTAVAVAAHEVGHAMQHGEGSTLLATRQRLARVAFAVERVAAVVMLAAPVVGAITRAPSIVLLEIGVGVALLAVRVGVHLVTLPVELDASFRRALPILRDEGYIPPDAVAGAREVLQAAAWTYVASALMSLLDVGRWFRVLR